MIGVLIQQEIENRLVNYNPNATDPTNYDSENLSREEYEVEVINLESAKAFKLYGGVKVSLFSCPAINTGKIFHSIRICSKRFSNEFC